MGKDGYSDRIREAARRNEVYKKTLRENMKLN